MSRSQRNWWWIFALSTAAVAGAFLWVTVALLASEKKENESREIGFALWTMDSWVGSLLIQESGRPYFEYSSYFPQRAAYTKLLGEIGPGEVLTPSPILAARSEFARIHFQWDPAKGFSSPQVPGGNLLDLASSTVLDEASIGENRSALAAVEASFRADEALPRIDAVERRFARLLRVVACGDPLAAEADREQRDFASRANAMRQQAAPRQWAGFGTEASAVTGPLVPLWLGDPAELFVVRRVRLPETELLQGIYVDWPRLRSALLEQIAATFPSATLAPAPLDGEAQRVSAARLMANLPVVLETNGDAPEAPLPWITPVRATVAIGWLAVLVAIAAAGLTLRSSMAFGEKRSRFASAVTHELRTPLTTFRMYSEMLADGMVPEAAKQGEYHATLKRESLRLSRLVENVLAYARLEEGRYASRRERLSVGALLDRVAPALRDRAAEAGLLVRVSADGVAETAIAIDPDAVGQILFNLVDNACKYAVPCGEGRIDLEVERADGSLLVSVRDRGPGVAREHAARVFDPFHRGPIQPGDAARPGVGLGLALARGLARDLGGDLTLDSPEGGGARFTLRVPSEK